MTTTGKNSPTPSCPLCHSKRTKTRFFLSGGGVLYRCRDCTVEFLSPQPDEQRLKEIYSERYYSAWGISGQEENESTRQMKRATFRLRLDLIRSFLQPVDPSVELAPTAADKTPPEPTTGAPHFTAPGRILDVGCATGYFLEVAAEAGFKPYGVEYSAYAAARARHRFGPDAIFQGTLEQSSFPPASFTVIAMSDLLEHVLSPATTLTRAQALLKPEGIILIMTPDTGAGSRRMMGRRWTHYKPEHLFYFNRPSLTRLANRCGLQVVQIQRAKKALNLAYLYTQFTVYRHWLLTPLVTMAYRLAPANLRSRNFYCSIGEMVVILKKNARPAN